MPRTVLVLFALLLPTGCAPMAPVLRAQYGVSLPLLGAPGKATHTIAVNGGALGTGPGAHFGGAFDLRFRPAGEVTGGQLGASAILTVSGASPHEPFLFSQLGVGLLGTTHVESERPGSSSFDLLSPHLDVAVGLPVARGFAFSLGLSLQYLWRLETGRADQQDVLLGSITVGAGFFDPHVSPRENALDAFFR